jgi:hypothetical protein
MPESCRRAIPVHDEGGKPSSSRQTQIKAVAYTEDEWIAVEDLIFSSQRSDESIFSRPPTREKAVSIYRQSRWLYSYGPFNGA